MRLASILCVVISLPAWAGDVDRKDQFRGDQVLYELSYNADFFHSLVIDVAGHCTGVAAPFFIFKLPNPSFEVKQVMLGGRFGFIGFIYPNPYSGKRFGNDDDPGRPSTASQRVAEELFVIAEEGEAVGYLCDVRLWDFIQDYATAQLTLVNYAINALGQEQRMLDAKKIYKTVDPLFEKIQQLVNGDPNRERDWRYELSEPTSHDTSTR